MGFFSFLSGRPDRIELALPAKDRADFLVYFTAGGGAPPTEGDLVGAALAWLDERVDEPLKTRLRRAIDSSGLLIELHPTRPGSSTRPQLISARAVTVAVGAVRVGSEDWPGTVVPELRFFWQCC